MASTYCSMSKKASVGSVFKMPDCNTEKMATTAGSGGVSLPSGSNATEENPSARQPRCFPSANHQRLQLHVDQKPGVLRLSTALVLTMFRDASDVVSH